MLRERSPSGDVREIWDCSAYWREHRAGEACDGNALSYNADTDTIYFSSDAAHTIVEVARSTGEVLHVWGQLGNAGGFDDPSSTFWKQHSPNRLANGNLLLSSWAGENNPELRAREYAIDEDQQVLRQEWVCGEGSGLQGTAAGKPTDSTTATPS